MHNFYIYPTDKIETYNIISLKPKHTCGHDISPKIIKENPYLLSEPLTHIINLSFQNTKIPSNSNLLKLYQSLKRMLNKS